MIIQIIATVIILIILLQLLRKILKDRTSIVKMIFWALFWGMGLLIIWLPKEILDSVGGIFGVGRGIDVLVYFSIIILFYRNLHLNSKIEDLEKKITKIVREVAKKT